MKPEPGVMDLMGRLDVLEERINARTMSIYTTNEARWLSRTPGPRTAPQPIRLCRYCTQVVRGDKCKNCGAPQN